MSTLTCCGNQPIPIVVGLLLVSFLFGFISSYPLVHSYRSNGNLGLGQVIYQPYISPSSVAASPSLQSEPSTHHSLNGLYLRPITNDDSTAARRNPQDYYQDTFRISLQPGLSRQRLVPQTGPLDFDYVPYIQNDLNMGQPLSSAAAMAAAAATANAEKSDLYEDTDYIDPLYDPADDNNWLNEAVPSYNQAMIPNQQATPDQNELLTNMMVNYLVKELEKSEQQQQTGVKRKSTDDSDDKQVNQSTNQDKSKRFEQKGQKEYPMLRPATDNKEDSDQQKKSSQQPQDSKQQQQSTNQETTIGHNKDDEETSLISLANEKKLKDMKFTRTTRDVLKAQLDKLKIKTTSN